MGIADLPLHSGEVPKWLLSYMERIGKAIIDVLVEEYGTEEIIYRFSDPLWFQAFNNAIGMDWDSSGSTTVVIAILKKITWDNNYGFVVLGGKGEHSLNIPNEVEYAAKKLDLDDDASRYIARMSRLGAKIDNVLLQDGYSLYHHSIIVSEKGNWTIIQQGMNTSIRMARRYHLSKNMFNEKLLNPHSGVASSNIVKPLNLTDSGSRETVKIIEDIVVEPVSRIIRYIRQVNSILKNNSSLLTFAKNTASGIGHQALNKEYIDAIRYYSPIKISRHLIDTINKIQLYGAERIIEVLSIDGVGPSVIRALALVADLIYGYRPSNRDPVTHPIEPFKYSFAHGGKDGVPYRVNRRLLENTIVTLEDAVNRAKLGDRDKLRLLRSLASLAREYGL